MRAELFDSWQKEAGGHDGPVIPTLGELQVAATEACYLNVQPKLAEHWNRLRGTSATAHEDYLASLRRVRANYIATKETTMLPKWRGIADKRIQRHRWALAKDTEEYDAFVQMVAEAAIELLRVEIDRRSGDFSAEPTSKVVTSALNKLEMQATPGETIAELFERYADQRLAEKRKRPDTVTQDRKIVLQFAAFVGPDRSIPSLTQTDVRTWRDAVAKLPPKFGSAKAFEGMSLREAALKAHSSGLQPMSRTTVNKYLSTVSPFLGWCVRNGYSAHNPCHGLFYDLPKGRNPRPPFTREQLAQIFASPLFSTCAGDGHEHVAGPDRVRDWRFWIPLLCLFTGARIGEIAQLNVEDLQYEDGLPFLVIKHDEATAQTTKSGHSRIAPVHSKLISLGFIDFAEQERRRAASAGSRRLFPQLDPNERGHTGATPSRFWRDYLKRVGIKKTSDGLGAHSFRHAMADELRQAGLLDEEVAVVLGHSRKNVTSGYGRMRHGTVKRLTELVEKCAFEHIIIEEL